MSRAVDCPKCSGTGKIAVADTDHHTGRKQHNIIWSDTSRGRGPWGWIVFVCVRCGIERTKGKKATMYRRPGGDWIAGFSGCNKGTAP